VTLNPIGFKIGLEVMAKGRYTRWEEVPYVFTNRRLGKSKFGRKEIINYLKQLAGIAALRLRGRRS
jgi:dolichol-phosphate mannosyltransferase